MKIITLILFIFLSVAQADIHTVNIQPTGERTMTISVDNCINCYVYWISSDKGIHGHINDRPTMGRTELKLAGGGICGAEYSFIISVSSGFHSLQLNICNQSNGNTVCSGYKDYSLPANNCDGNEQYLIGE